MYKKLIASTLVAATLVTGGVVGYASAQTASTSAPVITHEQAIEKALAQVDGEVQDVELERERGAQYYEVEIITADGAQMEVDVDAQTGDVLEIASEDYDDDDGDCDGKKGKRHSRS
ncbi:MAG: PepSY domain-containing protein [Ahrensia sp.]